MLTGCQTNAGKNQAFCRVPTDQQLCINKTIWIFDLEFAYKSYNNPKENNIRIAQLPKKTPWGAPFGRFAPCQGELICSSSLIPSCCWASWERISRRNGPASWWVFPRRLSGIFVNQHISISNSYVCMYIIFL